MLKEAANISRTELRRLKRIQAVESKKIRITMKQIQVNVFPYFLRGGPKTFKVTGNPGSADGFYGRESYAGISNMQADLIRKGFLQPSKASGRLSLEGVYGKETHQAFLKAKAIGAIYGNKEPDDEQNILKRIRDLVKFMDNSENKKQYNWALQLKGFLKSKIKPKTKPVEKETIKKVVKKAANDGKIKDDDVARYIWYLSIQAAAGNLGYDADSNEIRPIGNADKSAEITKKALAKIDAGGGGPSYIDPLKKGTKTKQPAKESKNYRIFERYFQENDNNFLVLTEKNLNCRKTLQKVVEILNSKD